MPLYEPAASSSGGGGFPVTIIATFGYTVVQGSWSQSVDAAQPLALYLNATSDAQNDEVTYKVELNAGTYRLDLLHVRGSNRGIYTFSLDGSSIGTIDGYNSTTNLNRYDTITGISVAAAGLKTLSVKMATKNASSSAYRGIFTAITLQRTA